MLYALITSAIVYEMRRQCWHCPLFMGPDAAQIDFIIDEHGDAMWSAVQDNGGHALMAVYVNRRLTFSTNMECK